MPFPMNGKSGCTASDGVAHSSDLGDFLLILAQSFFLWDE